MKNLLISVEDVYRRFEAGKFSSQLVATIYPVKDAGCRLYLTDQDFMYTVFFAGKDDVYFSSVERVLDVISVLRARLRDVLLDYTSWQPVMLSAASAGETSRRSLHEIVHA